MKDENLDPVVRRGKELNISLQETGSHIIGNGDRKSWDPRTPVIWDYFAINRT